METICPFCHQKHAISQADVGKQMRCPGCHHTFTANPVTGLGIAAKTPPPSVAPTVGTRSPAGMPTLPDSPPSQPSADPSVFLSEGGAKQPADLLARYREVRSRSASPLARIVEVIKMRIHVAQLRRQVISLQEALDAAWERLGMLAIGHRPFHSHLRTELQELSALQQQVSEKQSMADSLRQTHGSKPVLKEVESELAELRDRQRRLMIAIGQKAEANTPDIPDGSAHYAAVKRLRSGLENAERELLGIEGLSQVPAGRFGTGGLGFLSRVKTPLLAGGAVLVFLLVVWAAWGLFGSGYSVEYKLVSLRTFSDFYFLEVTVKGKAAKLAVILTSPSGESTSEIIEADEMITNNTATVRFPMEAPQPGRYVITVKTLSPKAVVAKKNVDF